MTKRALCTCLARTPSLIHRWFDSGTRYWYADQSGNCVSLQLWAYVSIGRNALAPRLSPLPHSFSLSPSLPLRFLTFLAASPKCLPPLPSLRSSRHCPAFSVPPFSPTSCSQTARTLTALHCSRHASGYLR